MKSTLMFVFVLVMCGLILTSLFTALYYLVRDQGKSKNTVRALTFRISLSIILFLVLFLAFAFGWISPHPWYQH